MQRALIGIHAAPNDAYVRGPAELFTLFLDSFHHSMRRLSDSRPLPAIRHAVAGRRRSS
jgi:hypothetical protein